LTRRHEGTKEHEEGLVRDSTVVLTFYGEARRVILSGIFSRCNHAYAMRIFRIARNSMKFVT